MPLEHEAVGPDPFVDREQPPARFDRTRRLNGLDQSDKEFNSVVRHQLGLWRQAEGKSPIPTVETTEQESPSRPLLAIHPGKFLSICGPVYRRKLVRDPSSIREQPISEA